MPVITISRQSGCGDELCRRLAQKLNYHFLNKEIAGYAAIIGGMQPDDAEAFDEYHHSRIHNILRDYLDLSLFNIPQKDIKPMTMEEYSRISKPFEYSNIPSGENFQKSVEKVIQILANDSNVIITGRGGNFILANYPGVLHVRLVAPLEMRIKNISVSMNIDLEDAKKYALTTDKKKRKYIKSYFKESIDDPLHYHMLLNLGKLSGEEAISIMIDSLQCVQQK